MALIVNRKAKSEYEIEDKMVAGAVLTGPEVKSLRLGQGSLAGSYIKIIDSEAFLIGAQINPYSYADNRDYDAKRTRKLLFKRKQLDRLIGLIKYQRRTMFPLAWFIQGRKIKLEVGIGRGRRQYEKREVLKRRKQKRDLARKYKSNLKGF